MNFEAHPYFPTKPPTEWEERAKRKDEIEREDELETKTKHVKTATELFRTKLDHLNKNFDKPVKIPEPKKEWKPPKPPDFVRNVVGSSAGAGSGEYHIYRNLRRKEYARQDYIKVQAKKDAAKTEFEEAFEAHKTEAEERTAKKRAKRLRKKEAAKRRKIGKKGKQESSSDDDEDDEDGNEEEAKDNEKNDQADDKNNTDNNQQPKDSPSSSKDDRKSKDSSSSTKPSDDGDEGKS